MNRKKEILIIAEGTYPYIKGGVSTWIHQLISGLEDFDFSVLFIGSKKSDYDDISYELPKNLKNIYTHYLFDKNERPKPSPIKSKKNFFNDVEKLHLWFNKKDENIFPENFKRLDFYTQKITQKEFLYSFESWEYIKNKYMKFAPQSAFIDYFWTVRNMHAPIWKIAQIAKDIEPFDIIHSPSTGYAGFLGSLLSFNYKKPFILTEHGIYTRERKIDMLNADWLIDTRTIFQKEIGSISHIKNMWIKFFEGLGKVSYEAANPIISLFDRAREIQIDYGADPKKTKVIPNGVDVEKLKKVRVEKKDKNIISLIGRVVPIKDIKTFIKAIRIVVNTINDCEGWIVGPMDEDENYANECKFLVEALSLEKNIKFLGFKKIDEILPKTKILTLSSISEGMPLVIIEGFAAGIPAVTTDVGSCRQLIYGGIDKNDKMIGKAGEVVPIANPSELANAYIKFLTDSKLWEDAKKSAIKRVEKYYTLNQFLQNYKKIYQEVSI